MGLQAPPPTQSAIMYDKYCLDPKWQRRWMWLSILILGPCVIIAGLTSGQRRGSGVSSSSSKSQTNPNKDNEITNSTEQWVFLEYNQILRSDEPSLCVTTLPTTTNTTMDVCLNLQTNGNLLLFQIKGQQPAVILWSSQVSLTPGDYWVRLQGDGNLVTTRGRPEDDYESRVTVWDSKSASTVANYRLVWDTVTQGMQIERYDKGDQGVVVMWSAVSTLTDSKPAGEGLDWQPFPTPTTSETITAPIFVPVPAPVVTPTTPAPIIVPVPTTVPVPAPVVTPTTPPPIIVPVPTTIPAPVVTPTTASATTAPAPAFPFPVPTTMPAPVVTPTTASTTAAPAPVFPFPAPTTRPAPVVTPTTASTTAAPAPVFPFPAPTTRPAPVVTPTTLAPTAPIITTTPTAPIIATTSTSKPTAPLITTTSTTTPTSFVFTAQPIPLGTYTDEQYAVPEVWYSAPLSSTYSLRSGPLVGHVTDTTVKLWALQGASQVMELVYRRAGDSTGSSEMMVPNADQGASILQISNLQADTQYEYEVRIQGERVGGGVWKTASPQMEATTFKFLLASCMDFKRDAYKQQPVWDVVMERGAPDFAMLNGDTVYLNEDDWDATTKEIILERVWHRNIDQRGESHFKNFIANLPTYSVWDDHEYGGGNSGMNQPGKYNSLRAFRNLWANPSAGTPSLEGVFYSFYRGNVHFIVCDNRWYRSQSTGRQWGIEQLEWISDELKGSQGVFKIIVSGTDVMEQGMAQDTYDLGRVIKQYGISGVLFCAGDIHRNEFKAMENDNWPYKINQISSSAIAREWRRPWAMVHVDTTISDPTVTAYFYGAESTSQTTTWTNDPTLRCSSIQGKDRSAEAVCTETIRLSDLTP